MILHMLNMDYVDLRKNILEVTKGPLAGTTLTNLLRLLAQNRFKIYPVYLPRILYNFGLSSLLLPLRFIEHLKFSKKIKATKITNDPIFIIGHWRSGTTYLHNILSLDKNLGIFTTFSAFVPSIFLGFEDFFKPIVSKYMPTKRPMDNIKMDADYPQEEEYAIAALCPYSVHNSICFSQNPSRYNKYVFMENVENKEIEEWKKTYIYILKKATIYNNGKQLVLKNPSNTARVKQLLDMFPNAKFIHIYRNPYRIYRSMMKFLTIIGPLYCVQKPPTIHELEAQILTVYKKMYKKYFKEKKLIPKENLIEIRYEEFITDPINRIKEIYNYLSLPGYKKSEKLFIDYKNSQRNFKTSKYEPDEETKKRITKEWEFAFSEFGYKI